MKRSKFSLSHYKLLTVNQGNIIPISWFETLPGDSIQQSTSCLIRAQPLLAPLMHPVKVRIHNWFVPYRLLWEDWEDFITGGEDGNFTAAVPKVVFNSNVSTGSLADYMGVPTGDYTGNDLAVNALPFRAYNFIFNEFYRDQQLIDEIEWSDAAGVDSTTPLNILNCAWEKDYFTTALPAPQLGDDILIPITGSGYISGMGKETDVYSDAPTGVYESGGNLVNYASAQRSIGSDSNQRFYIEEDPDNPGYPNLRAAFENASITVNDLREALALQRYQEARSRYGARYVEYLRYLGIRNPSDARLQRPEYIGGGSSIMQFSEVLQTQRTDEDSTPQGNMTGHGISAMRTNRTRRFFEEHGLVMSFMSVIPKSMYLQALHKQWSRLTKEDYFQKELQFIGEQPVHVGEINALQSDRTAVFGYQDRYDEYRTIPSTVSGEFRDTLNYWHMARDFAGDVALNETFITADPTTRVYSAPGSAQLYVMANQSIQARRILTNNPKPRTF